MPYLETPEELAEALADACGIYNAGIHFVGMTPEESRQQEDWLDDHAEDCQCRMCWTGRMARRIRKAVHHEQHVSTSMPAASFFTEEDFAHARAILAETEDIARRTDAQCARLEALEHLDLTRWCTCTPPHRAFHGDVSCSLCGHEIVPFLVQKRRCPMHDPMTVAHTIKRPWPQRQRHPHGQTWRYFPDIVVIWHRDPETDGSDDSCGWTFPTLTPAHRAIVDTFVRDDLAFPYFSSPEVRHSGVIVNPEYQYPQLPPGDCLALLHSAWLMIAWELERRRLNPRDLLTIANLATCRSDNLRTFLVDVNRTPEDLVRAFFVCVLRNYLRFRRPWYRHPRWHVHHWEIQVPLLQTFKRWVWSRCCRCGKPFRWGASPTTDQWDNIGPRWFRGEPHVYHGDCAEPGPVQAPEKESPHGHVC